MRFSVPGREVEIFFQRMFLEAEKMVLLNSYFVITLGTWKLILKYLERCNPENILRVPKDLVLIYKWLHFVAFKKLFSNNLICDLHCYSVALWSLMKALLQSLNESVD